MSMYVTVIHAKFSCSLWTLKSWSASVWWNFLRCAALCRCCVFKASLPLASGPEKFISLFPPIQPHGLSSATQRERALWEQRPVPSTVARAQTAGGNDRQRPFATQDRGGPTRAAPSVEVRQSVTASLPVFNIMLCAFSAPGFGIDLLTVSWLLLSKLPCGSHCLFHQYKSLVHCSVIPVTRCSSSLWWVWCTEL